MASELFVGFFAGGGLFFLIKEFFYTVFIVFLPSKDWAGLNFPVYPFGLKLSCRVFSPSRV